MAVGLDVEAVRAFLLRLPHSVETMQWGDNLVYWVGDKALGGKMFALVSLHEELRAAKPRPVLSFLAGAERFAELLEWEGFVPAPYFARIFWVAMTDWAVLSQARLEPLLAEASRQTLLKLPARTRQTLQLPKAAQKKLIAEQRAPLAERETKSRAAKKAGRKKKELRAKGS